MLITLTAELATNQKKAKKKNVLKPNDHAFICMFVSVFERYYIQTLTLHQATTLTNVTK